MTNYDEDDSGLLKADNTIALYFEERFIDFID